MKRHKNQARRTSKARTSENQAGHECALPTSGSSAGDSLPNGEGVERAFHLSRTDRWFKFGLSRAESERLKWFAQQMRGEHKDRMAKCAHLLLCTAIANLPFMNLLIRQTFAGVVPGTLTEDVFHSQSRAMLSQSN